MAVKKYAKVDIKLFLYFSVLLDFSILFQMLYPGLYVKFKNSVCLRQKEAYKKGEISFFFCSMFFEVQGGIIVTLTTFQVPSPIVVS